MNQKRTWLYAHITLRDDTLYRNLVAKLDSKQFMGSSIKAEVKTQFKLYIVFYQYPFSKDNKDLTLKHVYEKFLPYG